MNERMVSTQTGGLWKYGSLKEVLSLLKESGFTAYDCTMCDNRTEAELLIESENYLENARELRAYADSISLPCNRRTRRFLRRSETTKNITKKFFRS